MKRARRLILPALAAGASLLAAGPAAQADMRASVRMLSCSPWRPAEGGSVSYEARMRRVAGTARMAVRFHLLEKAAPGHFDAVRAGDPETWRRSRRGATDFRWVHRVEGLRQGGVYRVEVEYRWLAEDGSEIATVKRRSKRCRQPGGQPNLGVDAIEATPGVFDGTERYRVTVVNRGESEARGVGVLLRVDGEVVDEADPIETLAPGESRTISFSGPLCRRTLSAVVDPKDAIAESHEDDNVLTTGCV
jgi:hypothetical protein